MTRKSRGWLIASAILSLLVGLVALSSPFLFSLLIVQFLGAFAFASGLISLFLAIFGKDVAPRGFNALFALIRIGAGVALLSCVRSGLNLITLIFATYLTVEGIFGIFGALKIRKQDGRGIEYFYGWDRTRGNTIKSFFTQQIQNVSILPTKFTPRAVVEF